MRNKATVVGILVGILVAGMAQSDTIRYKASGDYFDTTNSTGNANGWQSAAVPGSADTIRFNWGNNTVILSGAAPDVNQFQMGVDESGGLVVNSGGSLTALGNSKVGNNGAATGFLTINSGGVVNANGGWLMVAGNSTVTGIVTIDGGELNAAGHLWVATGAGSSGNIDITGGMLHVGGMLGLGTVNAVDPSGGTGIINIHEGGLLALSNISGGGTSIQPGSYIDLFGSGQLTLPGNFSGVLQGYVDNGYIRGNGLAGNVVIDLTSNDGYTTVAAIPEPTTLALIGLAGIGLACFRRKR